MNFRLAILVSIFLSAALLGYAWKLEPHRVYYDATIALFGAAVSIAVALLIIDRVIQRRDRDEWMLVRELALKQVCRNIEDAMGALIESFRLHIDHGIRLFLVSERGNNAIPIINKIAEILEKDAIPPGRLYNESHRVEAQRNVEIGWELIRKYGDISQPMVEIFTVQLNRLISSHADKNVIERIIDLENSFRYLNTFLLSYRRTVYDIETKKKQSFRGFGDVSKEVRLEMDIEEALLPHAFGNYWDGWAAGVARKAVKVMEQALPLIRDDTPFP